jgi:hypothetical protein
MGDYLVSGSEGKSKKVNGKSISFFLFLLSSLRICIQRFVDKKAISWINWGTAPEDFSVQT